MINKLNLCRKIIGKKFLWKKFLAKISKPNFLEVPRQNVTGNKVQDYKIVWGLQLKTLKNVLKI